MSRPEVSRPARRVVLELVAAVLWPVQVVATIVLLPVTAAVVADLERARARESGRDVTPFHERAGSWGAWLRTRVPSRGVWAHDVPVALVSLLFGFADIFVALFTLTGGVVLLFAPYLWHAQGVGVDVGPWETHGPVQAWLLAPLGVVWLVVGVWVLVLLSLGRDATLRVLTGDEERRLVAELGTVRLSRAAVVAAFEAERRRIERDLHDGAQQDLVALAITLGMLEHHAQELDAPQAQRLRDLARRAHEQADRALVRLRETVHGIHPRELTDHGLHAALAELAGRSPLSVDHSASGEDASVPSPVAGALYFVAAEALTNVAVHSGVRRAVVRCEVSSHRVVVTVRDSGCGAAVLDDGPGAGTGLAGLRERLRALGGELTVSSPAGVGTTVTATAPLPGA